jgi:hypothetical protein
MLSNVESGGCQTRVPKSAISKLSAVPPVLSEMPEGSL